MKIKSLVLLVSKSILIALLVSCSVTRTKNIRIIESTDIHGVLLP